MQDFKPTRRELREVQRLANECEIEMRVTQQLGAWYGMYRPIDRSRQAFQLSAVIAARSGE